MSRESRTSVEVVPPSEVVVERVASCEGVDPTDLPRLYDVIDPEALDALGWSPERRASGLEVEFTYHGYHVTVTEEGVSLINANGTRV